jgi:hypothetical protein
MGIIMRIFTLYDKDGKSYDITSKEQAFFYGIAGLGYEDETEFQRIDERYKLLSKYRKQSEITGTIRFWQPEAEQKYFEFAQFCQNGPLTLRYAPDSGKVSQSDFDKAFVEGRALYLPYRTITYESYYRRGLVTLIDKTDVLGNCLEITIKFKAETPWFKVVREYNYGGQGITGKKYDYEYPYNYSGSVSNQITIESDSRQQSPCKIIIAGPCTNPSWNHYLNGVLQSTGKVLAEILPNHRLIIDTTTIPYSIKEVNALNQEVADLYQASDFDTQRFIRLGYGQNIITVAALDSVEIGIGAEAEIEYATV